MSVNIFLPHHPFLHAKEIIDCYHPEKLPAPAPERLPESSGTW
jgi:hypothetical protein